MPAIGNSTFRAIPPVNPPQRQLTMLERFTKEHGEYIDINNTRLFADGAKVLSVDSGNAGNRGLSTFVPPPEDAMERLQARMHFLNNAIDQEQRKFDRFKAACLESASNHMRAPSMCPPPPANAEQLLHNGAERIKALRERLTDLQQQHAATPEAQDFERRKQELAADFEALKAQRNRIGDITY